MFIMVQGPVDTFSGYGFHSRDLIKSLFRVYPDAEYKFASLRWGNTPWGALDVNDPDHKRILDNILTAPQLPKQPDYFFQISVPNEFQPVGKFNVGITAGIETNAVSVPWIQGANNMDMIIVPSVHSRDVFLASRWEQKNPQGQIEQVHQLRKPIEVLFEGVDTAVYNSKAVIEESIDKGLAGIKEDFNFLFVGHWLAGDIGQDRKDIGMLIKTFLETFADFDDKPGLILKTSHATTSIIDRETILTKVKSIKEQIVKESPRLDGHLPNVYVVHGELTDAEMNSLYHHKKVKAFVTFTKGEGYGRPIAEFSLTGKPVICSKYSGPMDFLSPQGVIFLNGKVEKVHKSAVWKDVIMEESKWFTVDYNEAGVKMKNVFKDYGRYLNKGRIQRGHMKNFTLEKMHEKFGDILKKYAPSVPKETDLKLPNLKELPKLQKVGG